MSSPSRGYDVGPFRLEIDERALYREDRLVPLTPRCFDVLRELAQARGRVVTKERLLSRVWSDAAVEEGSLTRTVSMLREALGPEGAKMIETLPRIGYRLATAVVPGVGEAVASPAHVVWEEREFPLSPGENVVGREPSVAVRLDHSSVSRHHARIVVSETEAVLEDLGSKNGTYVGKKRLRAPVRIFDGDRVTFGIAETVFRRPTAGSTVTARRP